jgi:hypothetical protein
MNCVFRAMVGPGAQARIKRDCLRSFAAVACPSLCCSPFVVRLIFSGRRYSPEKVGGIPRRRFPPPFPTTDFFMRLVRRFSLLLAADYPLPPHGRRILRQRSEMGSRWIARREGSPLGRDLDAISWSVEFHERWEGNNRAKLLLGFASGSEMKHKCCRVPATAA